MRIGFDLDKVFINYPPFVPSVVIDWLYKNHINHKLSYRIPKSALEIWIRQLSHLSYFRPPIQKNIDYLHSLANGKKHQLFLISSRYDFLERVTHDILRRYNLISPFESIYLNTGNEQAHLFKERVVKREHIELFIDDDLPLVEYLKKTCPHVKIFHYTPNIPLEDIGQFFT